MFSLLLIVHLLFASVDANAIAPPPGETELIETIVSWRKAFAAGKITLHDAVDQEEKKSAIYRKGVLPEPRSRRYSHEDALTHLMERVVEAPSIEGTRESLKLAALGLGEKVKLRSPPFRVRDIALRALRRIKDNSVLVFFVGTVEDDRTLWPGTLKDSYRAAALRALGDSEHRTFRPLIESQLSSKDRLMRLAAVDALQEAGWVQSLPTIGTALRNEEEGTLARTMVLTMHSILKRHHTEAGEQRVREAIVSVIEAIGRTDWRTDLAIVGMLKEFRSLLAIPALIEILQKFVDEPGLLTRGKISTMLQHKTNEALQSLTGAQFGAEDSAQWRSFWEEQRDTFQLAPVVKNKGKDKGRTKASFFGIPVHGSRVVFIIDISGSMGTRDVRSTDRSVTRLEAAKAELIRAADALPEDNSFNVVFFSTGVQKWRSSFSRATASSKADLRRKVKKAQIAGSTNVYGALKAALGIKSHAYGERYDSQTDEIFLLSDGQPTVGEVIDTSHILEFVREGNRYNGVRINTVSMGRGAHTAFMKQLAKENGGKFVGL